MINIKLSKADLRKIFKAKRLSLTTEEIAEKSRLINENFIKNLLPQLLQKTNKEQEALFSIYLPSSNEVSTKLISDFFIKNNISFSYPKIVKEEHPLDFILSEKDQKFSNNNLYKKVLEPTHGKKILPNFLIIPLIAFDSNLDRLGMGGGFFDRTIKYLKNQDIKITIIALTYDFQRSQELLPTEKTDQKLDFIVTEREILT